MKYLLAATIITLMLFGCKGQGPKDNLDTSAFVRTSDSLEKEIANTDSLIGERIYDFQSAYNTVHHASPPFDTVTAIKKQCDTTDKYLADVKSTLKAQANGEDSTLSYKLLYASLKAAKYKGLVEISYGMMGIDSNFGSTWSKDNFGKGIPASKALLTLSQTQYNLKQRELAKINAILRRAQ